MIHGPRRIRHDAVAEAIVDAAERVLGPHGVDGCTVARVAAEVGCTAGALYRYFPSKEAILAAVTARAITTFAADVRPGLDAAPPGPEGAFVDVFVLTRAWAGLAARRPAQAGLLFGLLADPAPRVPTQDAGDATAAATALLLRLVARLDDAERAGLLAPADPVQRLVTIWGAAHGVAALAKLRTHGLPLPADAVDAAVSTVLLGLGADPILVRFGREAP